MQPGLHLTSAAKLSNHWGPLPNGNTVIAMTAAHVLDGVIDVQKPVSHAHSTTPKVFRSDATKILDLRSEKLRVISHIGTKTVACPVNFASMSIQNHDIALLQFKIDQSTQSSYNAPTIGLDLSIPQVGDAVVLCAFEGLSISEQKTDGKNQSIQMQVCPTKYKGFVTKVYPEQGISLLRSPCFVTSIPVSPGMSGGAACVLTNGSDLNALGVISTDSSGEKAFSDNTVEGFSMVSMVWPAACLALTSDGKQHLNNLYDLVQAGVVRGVGEQTIDIKKHSNGNVTVSIPY